MPRTWKDASLGLLVEAAAELWVALQKVGGLGWRLQRCKSQPQKLEKRLGFKFRFKVEPDSLLGRVR